MATFYVAKTGSDSNDGSDANPKLTIGAGLAIIGTGAGDGANDIVEVRAGTYDEALENEIPRGTSWAAPFTLQAKAGDVVVIKAPNSAHTIYYDSSGSTGDQYAIIQDFILDGINQETGPGIVTFSAVGYVRLLRCEVKNTSTESIPNIGGNHIYISTTAHHCEVIENDIHDGTGVGGGVYCEGADNLIEFNHIYNMGRLGVQANNDIDGNSNRNVIRWNRIHACGLLTVVGQSIIISDGADNKVYGNLCYDNAGTGNDGGVGIVAAALRTLVYNNVCFNNTWMGISAADSTDAVIKNNIFFGNAINTVFDDSQGGANPVNLTQSNNLTTDPLFVAEGGGDFHLQSGSDAIDAGADLGSPYDSDFDGVARPVGPWEIGAYEFEGGGEPPPTYTVAYDAASSQGVNGTTNTFSHTTSGANRLLIVGIAVDDAVAISSVTYGGQALTLLAQDASTWVRTAIWYKINPLIGANNVVVTIASAMHQAAGAVSFTGVHQVTPLGTHANINGVGTSQTRDVTGDVNGMTIDAIAVDNSPVLTIGANQTSRVNLDRGGNIRLAMSTEAGSGTKTMSWSWTGSLDNAQIAVPIKPAPIVLEPAFAVNTNVLL